jgi:Cu-Zn family superoxide dismutase
VVTTVAIATLSTGTAGTSRAAAADRTESSVAIASRPRPRLATTTLRTADGNPIGTVSFRTRGGGSTEVEAKIQLPPGVTALDAFHGFHVHANNKPENGEGCLADPAQPPATWFASADGHLAEAGQKHANHTGDLPSLLLDRNGLATIRFTSTRLDVADLDNRAVIVHAGPDNFANVPVGPGPEQYTANSPATVDKTAATGNAGDRLACGVLKIIR